MLNNRFVLLQTRPEAGNSRVSSALTHQPFFDCGFRIQYLLLNNWFHINVFFIYLVPRFVNSFGHQSAGYLSCRHEGTS